MTACSNFERSVDPFIVALILALPFMGKLSSNLADNFRKIWVWPVENKHVRRFNAGASMKTRQFLGGSIVEKAGKASTTARDDFKPLVLDELRGALEKGFDAASDRQRKLLEYLVTEELEGRGPKIKAYAIATQVLNRPEDFDAQTDSIVRVEVGRLRQALEHYYLTSGAGAKVLISIPKGQYRPNFSFPAPVPAPMTPPRFRLSRSVMAAAWGVGAILLIIAAIAARIYSPLGEKAPARKGPLIAIAPLSFASDKEGQNYLGGGLQAELAGVLSEFDWLVVVPLTPETAKRADEDPAALNADFLLRSSVRLANDALSTTVLLLDGRSGAVMWTRNYDLRFRASEVIAMERDIAAKIGSDLGHPLGIVANIERTRMALDEFRSDDAFRCHLRALQYWSTFMERDYAPARQCMEAMRNSEPPEPNSLATLSLLVLDPGNAAREARPRDDVLADATRLSKKAYELNALGLIPRLARYNAAMCERDMTTFRRVGRLAAADYPNNPLILTDFGARLVLGANAPAEGLPLIARAREITSRLMPVDALAPAVDALRRGAEPDLASLRDAASQSASPSVALVYLAAAASIGDIGELAPASKRLEEIGFGTEASATNLAGLQCWSDESRKAVADNIAKAFRLLARRRSPG